MKKIINGSTFNTETATCIGSKELMNGNGCWNAYQKYNLYKRNKDGKYFVVAESPYGFDELWYIDVETCQWILDLCMKDKNF